MKRSVMIGVLSMLGLMMTACGQIDLKILTATPAALAQVSATSGREPTPTEIADFAPTATLPASGSQPGPTAPVSTTPAPPAATLAPAPQGLNPDGTYTVQPGDTLFQIGLQFGLSVETLQALNSLTGTTIYPGQSLKVSGRVESGPGPTPTPGPAATQLSGADVTILHEQVKQDLAGVKQLDCIPPVNSEAADAQELGIVQTLTRMLAHPAARPYSLEALQAMFAAAVPFPAVNLHAQSGQFVLASVGSPYFCISGGHANVSGLTLYIIDRTVPGTASTIGFTGRKVESVLWLPEQLVVVYDAYTSSSSWNSLFVWHIAQQGGEWQKTYELELEDLDGWNDHSWTAPASAVPVSDGGIHRLLAEFVARSLTPPCEFSAPVKDQFEIIQRGYRRTYAWQGDAYRRVGDDELRFTTVYLDDAATPTLPDWETYCVSP